MPLENSLGFTPNRPCPKGLTGDDLCTREHYRSWWELALEVRRTVFAAMESDPEKFGTLSDENKASLFNWLRKWAADGAGIADKQLAITKPAPKLERPRFEHPNDLNIIDADVPEIPGEVGFNLLFRDETQAIAAHVADADLVLTLIEDKAGIEIDSEAVKQAKKGGKTKASGGVSALVWVALAAAVGVGIFLFTSDGEA